MIAPLKTMAKSLSSFWSHRTTTERVSYTVGLLLLLSGFVHGVILITSGGSWHGPLSFRKPATFGFSFGLTLITIVWVSAFLEMRAHVRTVLLAVFTGACAWETLWVSVQTWRGVPSHFNLETPFDATIARSLAIGGGVLITVITALTVACFRTRASVPASMRLALRAGFVALLAAQISGAVMIAKGMTLVFRGNPTAAYATAGFLKSTHAVTMHGVLILPALAWVLSSVNWTEQRRPILVRIAVSAYALLVGIVAATDLAGFRFSRMSVSMIALFALSLSSLSVTTLVALAARFARTK